MKIQYLGTSASEGIPTFMCECKMCMKARKLKGRYIRTRQQACINDNMLIDFNPDTYMHLLMHDINLINVDHILITHKHRDHFYPEELAMMTPKFAENGRDKDMYIYGSEEVIGLVEKTVEDRLPFLKPTAVRKYVPFLAGSCEVTPIEANHGEGEGFFVYSIKEGGKTLFYGHDTDYFKDSVWDFFATEKPYYDLVSLDCTRGHEEEIYTGHMNVLKCFEIKKRMMDEDVADKNTKFVLSHFSHNGGYADYDEMCKIAEQYGFIVAYDGMELLV